jgi:hypothetical protein
LTETDEYIGLTRLLQKEVDKTFQSRGAPEYRLTNDKGYMIEFVRPEPRPAFRATPGSDPLEAGDIQRVPILGLQWLVNAPVVEVVVIDERGFPAPMRCPDPRFWAAHKLWISARRDREGQKKIRDKEQAEVLLRLIAERLPQFALDNDFKRLLPRELAGMLAPEAADFSPTRPAW